MPRLNEVKEVQSKCLSSELEQLVPEAGNLKNFIDKFELFAQAPNGIEKLRELILYLACTGKLSEQSQADSSVNEFLKTLENEKLTLVKTKKIKKSKTLFPENKIVRPTMIPENWQWSFLGTISRLLVDGSHNPPKKVDDGLPMLSGQNVRDGYITLDASRYITESDYLKEIERNPIEAGDVFLSIVGSIGRSSVVPNGVPRFSIQRSIAQIKTKLNSNYLALYLRNSIAKEYYYINAKGTAQKGIYLNQLSVLPVAVPPLEEQKRIVTKVDELMALCDQLESQQQQQANTILKANNAAIKALLHTDVGQNKKVAQQEFEESWSRIINHFNTFFGCTLPMPPGEGRQKKHLVGLENVRQLRQAALQLAVMGKLVPQCSNEEHAEILLEKLRDKYSSTKKGKRAVVTNGVIIHPFELPKGWAWARFPELGEWGRGKSKHRPRNAPALFTNGKWPLIQTGDVANSNGLITKYSKAYSDFGLAQSKLWPKGTMCITIAANIADSAFLGIDACFPDSVVGLIPDKVFDGGKYFEYFIRTAKNNLTDYAPSTAQKNINLGILEQVSIPMPPLEEQKRIVVMIDRLMVICDQLEQQLNTAYSDAKKLVKATTKALVA